MKPNNLIVHHTGGTESNPLQDSSNYTVYQCNQDHKIRFGMKSSLGWWVGYHYFIDKNGVLTKTRKDLEEGAHTKGYNNTAYDKVNFPQNLSVGICLAGNFDTTLPTEAQKATLKKLLTDKTKEYGIALKNIVPHRAHAQKTCYGNKLGESWARNLLSSSIPEPKVEPVDWYTRYVNELKRLGLYGKGGTSS